MFGAPNLLNGIIKRTAITLLGNVVSSVWDFLFPGAVWGVFNSGSTSRAIELSSVVEVDVSADSRVSDYPVQTGSFVSYNKVANPNFITLRVTKDGSETSRVELLQWLEENKKDTTLFDILTPESRYSSMTLVGYRLSRSARSGAAMIVADTLWQEVRQIEAQYSTTRIQDDQDQPTTPTARVNPIGSAPNSAGGPVSWQ
ncbi:hypothetical protein [Myoviridae environmental samples]|nr:hypothetical protein [Myoviridae environmental samples]